MGRVSFHQLADRELVDSAQYYELESPGLGIAFLNEVERCLSRILAVMNLKRRPTYWVGRE
jgi:hypothetical protein